MVARLVEGTPACVVLRVWVGSLPEVIIIVVVMIKTSYRLIQMVMMVTVGDEVLLTYDGYNDFLPQQLPHKVDVPFLGRLPLT